MPTSEKGSTLKGKQFAPKEQILPFRVDPLFYPSQERGLLKKEREEFASNGSQSFSFSADPVLERDGSAGN